MHPQPQNPSHQAPIETASERIARLIAEARTHELKLAKLEAEDKRVQPTQNGEGNFDDSEGTVVAGLPSSDLGEELETAIKWLVGLSLRGVEIWEGRPCAAKIVGGDFALGEHVSRVLTEGQRALDKIQGLPAKGVGVIGCGRGEDSSSRVSRVSWAGDPNVKDKVKTRRDPCGDMPVLGASWSGEEADSEGSEHQCPNQARRLRHPRVARKHKSSYRKRKANTVSARSPLLAALGDSGDSDADSESSSPYVQSDVNFEERQKGGTGG